MIMYNIGLKKLILQQQLSSGDSHILELNKGEHFVNFIDFNDYQDIGFTTCGLQIEACSRFAYLTFNTEKKHFVINVLLIDPYYGKLQISIFRSTGHIDAMNLSQYKDTIIKTTMYKSGTGNELKLIN